MLAGVDQAELVPLPDTTATGSNVWLYEAEPEAIDHTPPGVASVKAAVLEPTQTVAAPPPIAATVGNAFTVKAAVAVFEQVPLL